MPPEETAGALEKLVAEGKIRHADVSNYDIDQRQALGRFTQVETLQPPYHLFRRDIEDAILPYTTGARHRRAGVRTPGPRPALRSHDRVHDLRCRRLARQESGLHRRDLPPETWR